MTGEQCCIDVCVCARVKRKERCVTLYTAADVNSEEFDCPPLTANDLNQTWDKQTKQPNKGPDYRGNQS